MNILSDLLSDFRREILEFVEKSFNDKLDNDYDKMFIKVPTLEEDIGSYDKHQGDVDASNQTRNNRAFISNSSDVRQKWLRKTRNANSPIGEIFINIKTQHSFQDRYRKSPIKMSREILNQVDDDLGI